MDEKKPNNSPIFIIGNPRSGTTLLRVILNTHKELSLPHEFQIIDIICTVFKDANFNEPGVLDRFLEHIYNTERLKRLNIPREIFEKGLRSLNHLDKASIVHTYFESYLQSRNEPIGTRWGDKTIGTIAYIPEILEMFPNAKFIHIIRDVRDVVCSMKERVYKFKFPNSKLHYTHNVIGGAYIWKQSEAFIQSNSDLNNTNYIKISYSNLIAETEEVLNRITQFLDIPFDKNMLEYYRHNSENGSIPEKSIKGWHENTFKPPQQNKIARYKLELNDIEMKTINFLAAKELEDNGFEVDNKETLFDKISVRYNILKYHLYRSVKESVIVRRIYNLIK
jgi:hypothetical protein